MHRSVFLVVGLLAACSESTTGGGISGTTTAADAKIDGGSTGDGAGTVAADGTTADASTDSTASAKYATCSSALNCARVACTADVPTGCAQPCLDAASPDAKAGLQDFLGCIDNTCKAQVCPPGSPAGCLGACVISHCGLKAVKCAADGKVGTASCGAAFACLDKCKNAPDWACGGACYAGLNAQGQGQLDAMSACFAKSTAVDAATSCPGEMLQCISGGKSGLANCRDTLACFVSCPQDSNGCGLGCFEAADVKAQQQMAATLDCNANNGGQTCADAVVACVAPTGTKTCTDVIACMTQCGGKTATCNFNCLGDGSAAEATKVMQLFACSDAKCKSKCAGDGACQQACAKKECPLEFAACVGG